jgi:hypothetical protein
MIRRVLAIALLPLSPEFLDLCAKVRNNDPSILPVPGNFLRIRHLIEKEDIEPADALLENNSVTYLELGTAKYAKGSAEAMAKYVPGSYSLERRIPSTIAAA